MIRSILFPWLRGKVRSPMCLLCPGSQMRGLRYFFFSLSLEMEFFLTLCVIRYNCSFYAPLFLRFFNHHFTWKAELHREGDTKRSSAPWSAPHTAAVASVWQAKARSFTWTTPLRVQGLKLRPPSTALPRLLEGNQHPNGVFTSLSVALSTVPTS